MVRRAAVILSVIAAIAACGSGTENNENETSGSLAIEPAGMTLLVGTSGTLSAEVRNGSGALDPGAVVSWSTTNQAIASITSDGVVTGHVVGATKAIATSGDLADTVPVVIVNDLTLSVLPGDTTIPVLGTAQYEVVAVTAQGDTVPAPPVVWTATDSGVAGITQGGLAVGRVPGGTGIVATAGAITSDTAQLTVTGGTGSCFGITSANRFRGTVQWGYKAVDSETDGGYFISADDNGTVHADMPKEGDGPFLWMWTGPVLPSSSASVTQKKTDGEGGQSTYTSISGEMQPQPAGLGLPKLTLIVDASTCKYSLTTAASLATLLTDFFGNQVNAVDVVALVQFRGTVPPDWRTNGLVRPNGLMMANSILYAGLHPDEDVLSPLGFVVELFNSPAPGDVGQASGGYAVEFEE